MLFPEEYLAKEIEVKLTKQEIESIIGELDRTEHNIYAFLNYDKTIEKLNLALKETKNNGKK